MIVYRPDSLDYFEPVETPLILHDDQGNPYNPKGYRVTSEYLTQNISRPHPLWEELVGRIAAKKQDRILVPELETAEITSQTVKDISLAYLGTGVSRTIFARNKGKADCRYLSPSTGGIGNSELAREYLKLCLEEASKEGKVSRGSKRFESYLKYPATLFYQPGPDAGRHFGRFAYVDISSAYWTIQRTSTIDMRFIPQRQVLTGRAEYLETDEVTDYRGLRHAVPGTLKSSEMLMYKYGEQVDAAFRTALFYPGITGYTMYVMHCIAREVIDHFGASMVLTDAYIIPQDRADELVYFLKERWGVDAVVKAQGRGALYGLNCYQIGTHRTGHAPPNPLKTPSWFYETVGGDWKEMKPNSSAKDNIMDVDSFWMHRERTSLLNRGTA